MPELLSSKVVVIEEEPRIRGVPSLPSAVLAILGRFERGPVGVPTRVTSYAEFVQIFGGVSRVGGNLYYLGPLAVRSFFLNGGRQAWVLRVAHYTNVASPATVTATRASYTFQTAATAPGGARLTGNVVGPFSVEDGDTLHAIWSHDSGVTAANRTATVDVAAAQKDSAAVGAGFNFNALGASPWSFRVRVNSVAQTITFVAADFANPAAATAAEVAAAMNLRLRNVRAEASGAGAAAVVRLITDRRGTGAALEVLSPAVPAIDANLTLGYTTGPGTIAAGTGRFTEGADIGGDIYDAAAVTVAELSVGLQAIFNRAGLPAGNNGLVVSSSGGQLSIATQNTGVAARLAIGDGSVNLETIFGLTATLEAGGVDLVTPEAGVAVGTSGAAVNTLLVQAKDLGAYGNEITAAVTAATAIDPATGAADTSKFNLNVYRNGTLVEQFPNLLMTSTDVSYVETWINRDAAVGGSAYISVEDQDAVGTAVQRRPATVAATALAGGGDGDAVIATDYVGDAAGLTGPWAFQGNEEVTVFICPDAAALASADCATVQNALMAYADQTRARVPFVVLDAPSTATDTANAVLAHRLRLTSYEVGALYWPWVTIPNPAPSVLRGASTPPAVTGNTDIIAVPPSGFIAGIMARLDANTSEGPFHQPAGVEDAVLTGAVGVYGPTPVAAVLREEVRDVVFPHRVNPIVVFSGTGVHIDGARTLKSDGSFPSVGERRGVGAVERNVQTALRFAKNRNNTPELRAAVQRTLQAYLLERCRAGCFASKNPRLAFFVDVSDALNPPSVALSGRLYVRVGMATARPAEFIIVLISQDTRALDEELRRG